MGRCSCKLRSVGAVLMPNVFVPMHQPLLSRSKALAPSASWPGTLRAVTSVQLSRASTLSFSLGPSISHRYPHYLFVSLSHYFRAETRAYRYVHACVRTRAGVRIVEEDRMSGRTAAEMRVTGIGLPVSHPPTVRRSPLSPLILPPHPPRGTAAPVCVLF